MFIRDYLLLFRVSEWHIIWYTYIYIIFLFLNLEISTWFAPQLKQQ